MSDRDRLRVAQLRAQVVHLEDELRGERIFRRQWEEEARQQMILNAQLLYALEEEQKKTRQAEAKNVPQKPRSSHRKSTSPSTGVLA